MIKRILFCSLMLSAIACSKTNTSADSVKNGKPIETDEVAKAVIAHILYIDNALNRGYSSTNRTTKDSVVLAQRSGDAVLNAIATNHRNVYSSGSVEERATNVIVQFRAYTDTVMTLDGYMQYYYYYSSRTDYGASGSASKTTSFYSYGTKYAGAGQTTAVEHPLAIAFRYNGESIKDSITFSVAQSSSSGNSKHTLKTTEGKTFSY